MGLLKNNREPVLYKAVRIVLLPTLSKVPQPWEINQLGIHKAVFFHFTLDFQNGYWRKKVVDIHFNLSFFSIKQLEFLVNCKLIAGWTVTGETVLLIYILPTRKHEPESRQPLFEVLCTHSWCRQNPRRLRSQQAAREPCAALVSSLTPALCGSPSSLEGLRSLPRLQGLVG